MDLYCPTCGEPWDNDCLHEEAEAREAGGISGATYDTVAREFRLRGCRALEAAYGPQGHCERRADEEEVAFGLTRSAAAAAMYDLLGDDMDGAAALLDDFGF